MGEQKKEECEHLSSSSSDSGSDIEKQEGEGETIKKQHHGEEDINSTNLKISRNERKARKAILKLGLKPIPEIAKVVIRKSKQAWFVMSKPDVFKSAAGETYVIFGHAESMGPSALSQGLSRRFTEDLDKFSYRTNAAGGAAAATPTSEEGGTEPVGEIVPLQQQQEDDNVEVDMKDVNLMVTQIGCTRDAAINALRKAKGDLVDAILELTQ